VLTDPQIHCVDRKKFGKGNLGYEGILMFFNSHICNEYCTYLGLFNPKTTSVLPNKDNVDRFQLFNVPPPPESLSKQIQKLCDLCRKPFSVAYSHFAQQRAKQ